MQALRRDDIDFGAYIAATDRPHSLEAEQSVLGALMLDPDAWGRLEDRLCTGDFYRHEHQVIFGAIERLARGGGTTDPISTLEQLKSDNRATEAGGLEYLHRLATSLGTAANMLHYADIVAEKARRRRLVDAGEQLKALARTAPDAASAITEAQQVLGELGVAVQAPTPRAQAVTLDLRELVDREPPPREWFIRDWLGPGPLLLAAAGGVGKSLLVQQMGTNLALGRDFVGAVEGHPRRSLAWACEDDADELWRRQAAISERLGIAIDEPADNLVLQSRRGVDNVLMAPSAGTLARTRVFEELRQQVNDLKVDVLWLDNVAHLFGGDEMNRGQVTAFINAIAGLVVGRPFAPILLAHTARAAGSEFAGSAAWENAVRMRWFMGNKLPDQKPGEDDESSADVRFLAKRKANYSTRDYVRFTMSDGVLVPDAEPDRIGGLVAKLDERKAEEALIAAFKGLRAMGIASTDGKNSPDFLPKQAVLKGLGAPFSTQELTKAMNRLMGRGVFVRGVVGTYSNRNPKQGLVLQTEG